MKISSLACVLIAGILFGFGLSYASMISPEVVLSFLRFEDFGLLWVLGAASFVTFLTYQLVPRVMSKPLLESVFGVHPSEMSRNTLVGAAIFGIGWGICGVCPGPAIAGLGAGNWPLAITLASVFAGAFVQGRISDVPPVGEDQ
ncbi:MAG: YeeE/YedE family protein [Gammaproteobacteria bacterium]|nr:YeeE/YedE family protein [Gammaproteobacteria bacterium]|tara:strand:+ start:730 stop:1161 length:432 start_codon:yes stop_codon:yes gene_type:complete